MNLCRSCGKDFASVAAFDRHRVGVHAYTYSEGVAMDPMREDGRRCLWDDEFDPQKWEVDPRGRWRFRLSDAERARLLALGEGEDEDELEDEAA